MKSHTCLENFKLKIAKSIQILRLQNPLNCLQPCVQPVHRITILPQTPSLPNPLQKAIIIGPKAKNLKGLGRKLCLTYRHASITMIRNTQLNKFNHSLPIQPHPLFIGQNSIKFFGNKSLTNLLVCPREKTPTKLRAFTSLSFKQDLNSCSYVDNLSFPHFSFSFNTTLESPPKAKDYLQPAT